MVALAIPKKVENGTPIVLARASTREEVEAEANQRALMIYGGLGLAQAIASAFGALRKRFGDSGRAAADQQSQGDLVSQNASLPTGHEDSMMVEGPGSASDDARQDFGWRLVFDLEPNGSVRWHVYDRHGRELYDEGIASDWDAAKLDAVLRLMPPSGER